MISFSERTLVIARNADEADVLRDVIDTKRAKITYYGDRAAVTTCHPNAIIFDVAPDDYASSDDFKSAKNWLKGCEAIDADTAVRWL